jgi:hypothetical protein
MNNGWVITEQDTAEEMAISKQVSKWLSQINSPATLSNNLIFRLCRRSETVFFFIFRKLMNHTKIHKSLLLSIWCLANSLSLHQ